MYISDLQKLREKQNDPEAARVLNEYRERLQQLQAIVEEQKKSLEGFSETKTSLALAQSDLQLLKPKMEALVGENSKLLEQLRIVTSSADSIERLRNARLRGAELAAEYEVLQGEVQALDFRIQRSTAETAKQKEVLKKQRSRQVLNLDYRIIPQCDVGEDRIEDVHIIRYA